MFAKGPMLARRPRRSRPFRQKRSVPLGRGMFNFIVRSRGDKYLAGVGYHCHTRIDIEMIMENMRHRLCSKPKNDDYLRLPREKLGATNEQFVKLDGKASNSSV